MIQTEFFQTRFDGVNLYRTYSDVNVMIQKDGTEEIYSEAIDVENSGFTYIETDIPIEGETGVQIIANTLIPIKPEPTDDLTVTDTLEMLGEMGVDVDE